MEYLNKSKGNWDRLTITLLIVSIILIVFSFFAPYLFTKPASNDSFDFTGKGEIGDVIGGIMNPFIALVGVLLTFLAFYMQIQANQLQRQLFIDGLSVEKQKVIDAEKKEHITRLKVIKALINSTLKYYKSSGIQLNKYVELEKKNPLKTNKYIFTTSSSYQNFIKLDILETYHSLSFYFRDKDIEWEEDFIKVLDYLDFYDKLIYDLNNRYNVHVAKKFEVLSKSGEKLNEIVNEIFTHPKLKENKNNDAFIQNTIDEANFENLQNDFLTPIIKDILSLFNETEEISYKNLLDSLTFVNKAIGGEKFQALNHAQDYENFFNNYFKDKNEFLNKIEAFNNLIEL